MRKLVIADDVRQAIARSEAIQNRSAEIVRRMTTLSHELRLLLREAAALERAVLPAPADPTDEGS